MTRSKSSGIVALAVTSVLSGAATLSSCNTTGCTENRSSILLAGFYSMETGKTIMLDSVAIGGVGAPRDSLLVPVGAKVSELYLPFRTEHTSTSFFIHYGAKALDYEELNDTIRFSYTSIPYFASEECGAGYRYRVSQMSYTRHLVDSVALVDSLITNVDVERLKVFFRTGSNDD